VSRETSAPISTTSPFQLTVTLPNGKAIEVAGRTARLIAWLVSRRQRIENLSGGALMFHVGAQYFTPEIREQFKRQQADALPSQEELEGR
jgi:hypothetical protein